MGNKQSDANVEKADIHDGSSTMTRAIARGRIYVVVRYPNAVEKLEGTSFIDDNFRELLTDMQLELQDFEITLDARRTDHFCEHVTFYNSNNPNKEITRPRVLVEIFYTGVYGGINKEKIKRLLQEKLDPVGHCYFDVRCELGRYRTTSHLETLLRL